MRVSEVRVCDHQSFFRYRHYIAQNPAKAGLVDSPENFSYCFTSMTKQRQQGLKPARITQWGGTTEVMP